MGWKNKLLGGILLGLLLGLFITALFSFILKSLIPYNEDNPLNLLLISDDFLYFRIILGLIIGLIIGIPFAFLYKWGKPYWLKGVIIALSLYIISLYAGFYGIFYLQLIEFPMHFILTRGFNYWKLGYFLEGGFPFLMVMFILPLILSILYGALFGWLYGKIKNRNQPQQLNQNY